MTFGLLHFITTSKNDSSQINTVYNLLWHALSLLSLLNLPQPSCNGFQQWPFTFLWVPKLSLFLSQFHTIIAFSRRLSPDRIPQEGCLFPTHSCPKSKVKVKVKVILWLMVSQSMCLGDEPLLVLLARCLLLFDSYCRVFVGCPLLQEVRSVVCHSESAVFSRL
jgi:hypothetical protein